MKQSFFAHSMTTGRPFSGVLSFTIQIKREWHTFFLSIEVPYCSRSFSIALNLPLTDGARFR